MTDSRQLEEGFPNGAFVRLANHNLRMSMWPEWEVGAQQLLVTRYIFVAMALC